MAIRQLVIEGLGTNPLSLRGAVQSLKPRDAAFEHHYTINGDLIDASQSQFHKYESTIENDDLQVPVLDNCINLQVTVHCLAELGYIAGTRTPSRSAVPDSTRVKNGVTMYRPILVMRIVSWDYDYDDYGKAVGWTMELKEA